MLTVCGNAEAAVQGMRIVERLHTEATQRQREQESRRVVLGRYGAVTNEAWAAKGESTDYEVRDRLAGVQGALLNIHVRLAAILGGGACLGGVAARSDGTQTARRRCCRTRRASSWPAGDSCRQAQVHRRPRPPLA
jgi:hypothetical protein